MTSGETEQRQLLVVTGASRGIGAHIARRADQDGYRVIGVARTAIKDVPFECRTCDVGDPAAVDELFRSLRREPEVFGLINAAGIAAMNLALSTPPDTIDRIVRTNLLGTMYCSSAMGKLLARRKQGRIINFSTIAVSLGLKGESVYAGSKAGVEGFSRAFAREMADFNVTVNTVAPGPVETDLIAKVPRDKIQEIVNQQIIGRQATAEDVWTITSTLLQPDADMITGQVINVGGA